MIERRQREKRLKRLILLLLFLAITIIGCYWLIHRSQPTPVLLSPIIRIHSQPSPRPTTQQSNGLSHAVQSALSGTHGTYGVVVQNLSTGEMYQQNGDLSFKSGSMYKLWVMAVVYQQLQDGTLKEDDILSNNAYTLDQEFGLTPDPQDETKTITYSVKDALYQMITISDNDAAVLLTDKVRLSTVAAFLQKNGFNHSLVGTQGNSPITSPNDVALFFKKLYDGQLGNSSVTEDMLNLLKQQKLNQKIPQYLPDDIVVAHKTGELDDYTHDGGIIYTSSGNYILVIMAKADDRDLANERIANISKAVYAYFTNTPTTQPSVTGSQ